MKIVTISMELVIDDDISEDYDSIADYLNDKLFLDPEFFGGFVPENVVGVINCVE